MRWSGGRRAGLSAPIPYGTAPTPGRPARRALRGRSPFHADRQHLHHILVALGLSPGQTVATPVVVSFALGAAGLAAEALKVPEYAMFYVYLTGFVAYGCAAEFACRKLKL